MDVGDGRGRGSLHPGLPRTTPGQTRLSGLLWRARVTVRSWRRRHAPAPASPPSARPRGRALPQRRPGGRSPDRRARRRRAGPLEAGARTPVQRALARRQLAPRQEAGAVLRARGDRPVGRPGTGPGSRRERAARGPGRAPLSSRSGGENYELLFTTAKGAFQRRRVQQATPRECEIVTAGAACCSPGGSTLRAETAAPALPAPPSSRSTRPFQREAARARPSQKYTAKAATAVGGERRDLLGAPACPLRGDALGVGLG